MASKHRPVIALGADHAGYRYKEAIKGFLESAGYSVEDYGAYSEDHCDYPDFVRPAAQAVASGTARYAIVLGGSGNGEAMVANKIPGVRCGLCWSPFTAEMTRRHNDANCLSLGARTISEKEAVDLVRIFLATPFDGERHTARVQKIEARADP